MSQDTDRGELTAEQKRNLAYVLDDIVPASAERRLPGAGELGVGTYVEETLRRTPMLWEMVLQGLSALEELTRARGAKTLGDLSENERGEVLRELGNSVNSFPPPLMLQAFAGYYQHPRVLEALGLEARPPHPKGYEMGEDDLGILEPVRRRAKMFRQV